MSRTTTYAQERLSDLYHNGGFTYDPLFGEPAQSGWAVGVPGHEEVIPLARISAKDIDRHAASLPANSYQGGWVKDGLAYLDAVELHTERDDAIRVGRKNKQIAIYNLRTGQEIELWEKGEK